MESLMKSDVFFFITSIAVILVAVALLVAIIYLIDVLKKASRVADKIESGVDEAGKEIHAFKENISESKIFNFLFQKKKTRHKKT